MNATQSKPQTVALARRGFPGIRCPLCGSEDVQTLALDELTTFRCAGCEDEYTAGDVRELLSAWSAVLAWIDAAPAQN
ncbi:MAG TPA: hypothetical protein VH643_09910 [Gemmataceae bacterium]